MKLFLLFSLVVLACALATALPQPEQTDEDIFYSAEDASFHSAESGDEVFHSAEEGDDETFHSAEAEKLNQTAPVRGKSWMFPIMDAHSKTTPQPNQE